MAKLSKENQILLRAALKGLRHKGGLEFTYKDMEMAFEAAGGHRMHFERMMRTRFPERYVRKKVA